VNLIKPDYLTSIIILQIWPKFEKIFRKFVLTPALD